MFLFDLRFIYKNFIASDTTHSVMCKLSHINKNVFFNFITVVLVLLLLKTKTYNFTLENRFN